jgi:hypothetical protein
MEGLNFDRVKLEALFSSTVGVQGGAHPTYSCVVTSLEKSTTTLKYLLDHTFSAFRIAISETSTVSPCRFRETI